MKFEAQMSGETSNKVITLTAPKTISQLLSAQRIMAAQDRA